MKFVDAFRLALKELGYSGSEIESRIRSASTSFPNAAIHTQIKPGCERQLIESLKRTHVIIHSDPAVKADVVRILNDAKRNT